MSNYSDVNDRIRIEHDRSWARSYGRRLSTTSDDPNRVSGQRRFQILSIFVAIMFVAAIITYSFSSGTDANLTANSDSFKASVQGIAGEHTTISSYVSFFVVPVALANDIPNSSIQYESGFGGFTPTWVSPPRPVT